MAARAVRTSDLGWIVETLAKRREPLANHAPVFWRPAPDAASASKAYMEYLLTDGAARGYRTDRAVLIAAPRGDGWLIDDLHVPGERWDLGDARQLWNALAGDLSGSDVRFVCPTYESDRAEFASSVGLTVAESWWLRELNTEGGAPGHSVQLPGVQAVTVAAPPVYAPPGPILFLPKAPDDPIDTVPAAVDKASGLGCAAIVVNVTRDSEALADVLRRNGFRQHCDYYTGLIRSL